MDYERGAHTHTPSAERARVPSHPYSRTGREKANSAALQIAYSSRSSQIQLTFNLQQHSLIVRRQVVLLYIDTGECTKGVGLDAGGSRDCEIPSELDRSISCGWGLGTRLKSSVQRGGYSTHDE